MGQEFTRTRTRLLFDLFLESNTEIRWDFHARKLEWNPIYVSALIFVPVRWAPNLCHILELSYLVLLLPPRTWYYLRR